MTPEDWDPAPFEKGTFGLGIWATGSEPLPLVDVDVLHGPVKVKVVAERDPTWVPRAPLDHWSLPSRHEMPQAGVITVLNVSTTWQQTPSVFGTGLGARSVPPSFTDRVPLGTSAVVLGFAWTPVEGCPAPVECRLWSNANQGRRFVSGFGDAIVERGERHLVVVWPAPDVIRPEPDYGPANQTTLIPYVTMMCPDGSTCGFPPVATSTDVTFRAEAWRNEVDLAAFKARLGVA